MKWIILAVALVGCTFTPKEQCEIKQGMNLELFRSAPKDCRTVEEKEFDQVEHELYQKGPKFKSGCFKITAKDNPYVNCTFFSNQGSIFLQNRDKGFSRIQRQFHGKWFVIFNKKIRCLDSEGGTFVLEQDVKPIKCPEELYH